jgi:hypothetical protein
VQWEEKDRVLPGNILQKKKVLFFALFQAVAFKRKKVKLLVPVQTNC